MKKLYRLLACVAFSFLAFASSVNADVILFSNDFDDGNLTPEIGTWNFNTATTVSSVVPTAVAGTANGSNVALFDFADPRGDFDMTLNLTNTGLLTGGNTVTIDFDFAARRTNGNSRTIFIDAVDSNGDIVTRLVMGDANAFGNGGGDRQRPGYDPGSAGNGNTDNQAFNGTTGTVAAGSTNPGSFWFGGDTNPATFDVIRDGQMSLTIGAADFAFATNRANNQPNTYSTTGVANYDGGTYADIASIQISSAGDTYGFYLDNLIVTATAIPEPNSLALLGLAALGFCGVRRRV